MAGNRGNEILTRMMSDIAELKYAVTDLRDATQTFAIRTTGTLDKLRITLETLIDHIGEVEARLDTHDQRLDALEARKASS